MKKKNKLEKKFKKITTVSLFIIAITGAWIFFVKKKTNIYREQKKETIKPIVKGKTNDDKKQSVTIIPIQGIVTSFEHNKIIIKNDETASNFTLSENTEVVIVNGNNVSGGNLSDIKVGGKVAFLINKENSKIEAVQILLSGDNFIY